MPSELAALICILFILYLFWSDMKQDDSTSVTLWIPMAWMFLAGSRYISQWFDLGGGVSSFQMYQEGSLVDSIIFAALIIAGATILYRRGLDWGHLLVRNKWIFFYFLFCAISIVWSDDSLVSFKRWIKALGDVIMALVILTEERPYEAVGTLLRRLAFVILPLSVLFIRFYPDLGRAYHMAAPMYIGAATSKNSLGQICLISGMYFSWSLIFQWHEEVEKGGIPRVTVSLLFLLLVAWLFYMADSATSLTCWLVVLGLFLAGRVPALANEPRIFVVSAAILVALLGVLEYTFGISDAIITGLGRSRDLTTRVPMWEMLLSLDTNPLIGVGYENFWSGERVNAIWRMYPGIIQAHNGYVDLFLNIGMVGLLLIVMNIIIGIMNVFRKLESDYAVALLQLAFILTVVLNNWTEASIKPISNMFVILLLGIMDVSGQESPEEDGADPGDRDYERE
jgi:exopolysaccharide production protein ExoQ